MSRRLRMTMIPFAVLTIFCISLALLEASPAHAQAAACESACSDEAVHMLLPYSPPSGKLEVTDLSGNVVGEGEHWGELRCAGPACSGKTQLSITTPNRSFQLEYGFAARQAVDSLQEMAVVTGSIYLTDPTWYKGQVQIIPFTATFQKNGDGTVSARYDAARPDASFIIRASPGTLVFRRP